MTAAAAEPGESESAGPDYSAGIMVALMLPETVAAELAVPDGLPADELHVTLAYLGTTDDVEDPARFLHDLLAAVSAVGEQHDPVEGVVGGVGRFTGEDEAAGDPFFATLDAPGLDGLRVDLFRVLEDAGLEPSNTHGFTPHITLAYVPKQSAAPLPRLEEPRELSIPALTVMYGTARIDVPLGDTGVQPASPAVQDRHGRTGALTAEEIADPRSWGDLYTLRTYRGRGLKAAWDESLHPRSGGRFAPKDQAAAPAGELPPDWLDRALRGDAAFVKPKGGGRRKKGPSAAQAARERTTAARKARATAARAARARVTASRKGRADAARKTRDVKELAELHRRDDFDGATDRENTSENQRRSAANTAIETAPTNAEKDRLRAQELKRRETWTQQQKVRHAQERARRRTYEIQRRTGASQAYTAESATRTAETTAADRARAAEEAVRAREDADVRAARGRDAAVAAARP